MHNSVQKTLQELYSSTPLEASELDEGARCLLEFFELLIETDLEQKREREKNNETF